MKNRWMKGPIDDRIMFGVRAVNVTNEEVMLKGKEWDTIARKKEMKENMSSNLYRRQWEEIGGQDHLYDNVGAPNTLF